MELSLGISPQDQSRHPQTPTTAARLSETVTRDSSISDSVIYRSVGLRLFTWYFQRSLSVASPSSLSTSGYNQPHPHGLFARKEGGAGIHCACATGYL